MVRIYFLLIFGIIFILPLFAADDWTLMSPVANPPNRAYFGMAHGGNDWILLFGGWSSTYTLRSDTWIYDYSSNSWTQDNTGSSPAGRYGTEMAYIGGTNVLLFGGDIGTLNNETWYYNLSLNDWTPLSPPTSPSARWIHGMAYIGDDKVLLFGGGVSSVDGETWLFDLSDDNWTQLSPTTSPLARYAHDMAYLGDDRVILLGGATPTTNNETWLFDLSDNNWTLLSPTISPSTRTGHSMAYMGGDKVLSFGSSTPDNLAWVFDLSDNTWSIDTNPSPIPIGRYMSEVAETDMSGNSPIILFGGHNISIWPTNTWAFGGGDYPLPVELSSFTVVDVIEGVQCQWTTESEMENLGFILERKSDGIEWAEIASYKTDDGLLGQGTTSSQTDYAFLDRLVEPNIFEYRLSDVDYDGVVTYHSVKSVKVEKAPLTSQIDEFKVLPAYPNPFNPSTTISYGLVGQSQVNITIYDVSGKQITTLLNTEQLQGWHSIQWNGTDHNDNQVPGGIYFSKITCNNFTKTTKLMLLK